MSKACVVTFLIFSILLSGMVGNYISCALDLIVLFIFIIKFA